MKVANLVECLEAKVINMPEGEREVVGGYVGDFLSFVMSKCPEDSVWFTVMSNVNVAAVAHLSAAGVVVICEGVKAEEQLVNKCKLQGINLLETPLSAYEASIRLYKSSL